MQRIRSLRKQFNWRMLLMRIIVNALALLITIVIVPKIYFVDKRLVSLLLLAVSLGILNAVVKPLIQFATLRFIFATYGVVVVLINAFILLLMALIFPNRFAVESIFWALVGGAIIGIISALLENLLGVSPPIVSEKFAEIRKQIKDREMHTVETKITRVATEKTLKTDEASMQDSGSAGDAEAILEMIGVNDTEGVAAMASQSDMQRDAESAAQVTDVDPTDQSEPAQREA